ncbi:hypothetical protein O9992_07895 [Vibrio lentus]|nr:hypothetical protein [Vibrio lentus]
MPETYQGSALIIGIARGIVVVMDRGMITIDTILFCRINGYRAIFGYLY